MRLTTLSNRALLVSLALTCASPLSSALAQDNSKPPVRDPAAQRQAAKDAKESERAAKDAARAKLKWFEKVDKDDKAAADAPLGFAMPALPAADERINADFKDIADLRGKVVVVQTFTTKNAAGLIAPEEARVAAEAAKLKTDDFVVIAVHTPEGVDKAKAAIEKRKYTMAVVLDSDGTLCDELGAFRRPLAYLVDRQGNVRYSCLSAEGITNGLKELAAETFDATVEAKKRDAIIAVDTSVPFPQFSEPVSNGVDLRGKPGPALVVKKWWNAAPNLNGKLAVVDFWATWCKPCRESIPHLNDLARSYPNDVACMGITDESSSNFDEGCLKHKLKKGDFEYAVGLDSDATMKGFFKIGAIPCAVVISSDGIVRWQGHPKWLNAGVIDSLVAANRSLLTKGGSAGNTTANRWSKAKR